MTDLLYRIKPLEWVKRSDGVEISPSIFGVYHVRGNRWLYQALLHTHELAAGAEASHEDAKRACNEDNVKRLAEALEPATVKLKKGALVIEWGEQ